MKTNRYQAALIFLSIFLAHINSGYALVLKELTPESQAKSHLEKGRYLDSEQKGKYHLTIEHGKPLIGSHSVDYLNDQVLNYILDSKGEFYVAPTSEVPFHSYLSGGQPVAAAGELVFRGDKIVSINNKSGHYRPNRNLLAQAVKKLQEQEALSENHVISEWSEPKLKREKVLVSEDSKNPRYLGTTEFNAKLRSAQTMNGGQGDPPAKKARVRYHLASQVVKAQSHYEKYERGLKDQRDFFSGLTAVLQVKPDTLSVDKDLVKNTDVAPTTLMYQFVNPKGEFRTKKEKLERSRDLLLKKKTKIETLKLEQLLFDPALQAQGHFESSSRVSLVGTETLLDSILPVYPKRILISDYGDYRILDKKQTKQLNTDFRRRRSELLYEIDSKLHEIDKILSKNDRLIQKLIERYPDMSANDREKAKSALLDGTLPYMASLAQCNRIQAKNALPERMHFIWIGSPMPKKYQKNFKSWIAMNPQATPILWYDPNYARIDEEPMSKVCRPPVACHDVHELMHDDSELLRGYELLTDKDKTRGRSEWASASDLIRVLALLKQGGVYSDVDAVCSACFTDMRSDNDKKLIASDIVYLRGGNQMFLPNSGLKCEDTSYLPQVSETLTPIVNNCFIAAQPDHPILNNLREQIRRNLRYMEKSKFLYSLFNSNLHRNDEAVFAYTSTIPFTRAIHQTASQVFGSKVTEEQTLSELDAEKAIRQGFEQVIETAPKSISNHKGDNTWANKNHSQNYIREVFQKVHAAVRDIDTDHFDNEMILNVEDTNERLESCKQNIENYALCLINLAHRSLAIIEGAEMKDSSVSSSEVSFHKKFLEILDSASESYMSKRK
jgi:mannosyltransferase OCH1-like enzyme